MSLPAFLCLALAIGIIAGLRALTAPMVVSWAAWLRWIDVHGTWAAFMGAAVTPWILTVLAVVELINDQRPSTPSRTAPPSFVIRLLTGGFSGAALAAGVGQGALLGIVFGAAGAVVGTLGGYAVRTGLVKALKVRDLVIAIPEDVVAVAGGFLLVSLCRVAGA